MDFPSGELTIHLQGKWSVFHDRTIILLSLEMYENSKESRVLFELHLAREVLFLTENKKDFREVLRFSTFFFSSLPPIKYD